MGAGMDSPTVRAVSIGGGTGQPNAIRALRGAGCSVSAIVAMADDGGSTGLLREKMGLNPPGDIRKCLVAMADDPESPLARAFEHRFGFSDNHTLGNLLIAALTQETGSFVEAIAQCNRMLGCHGAVLPSTLDDVVLCGTTRDGLEFRGLTQETGSFVEAIAQCNRMLGCHGAVLPSTLDDVVLCGTTRDGLEFRGEATLGTGPCALSRVWLSPRRPEAYGPAVQAILDADIVVLGPGSLFTSVIPLGTGPCALSRVWLSPRRPEAYGPAVQAILDADIVVLGPGSLFTSVIPNLLVPGILDALQRSSAPKVYVCSMADMQGESWGLNAEEYVDALLSHGMEGHLDAVLIHRPTTAGISVATRCFQALTQEQVRSDAALRAAGLAPAEPGGGEPDWYFRPVQVDDGQIARLETRVPLVIARDFSDPELPTWHSLSKLTSVLRGVIASCPSRLR